MQMDLIVECLLSTSSLMRLTALKGIGQWKDLPSHSNKFLLNMAIIVNDTNDDVKVEAIRLQAGWDLLLEDDALGEQLVVELINKNVHLQEACSAALGKWLTTNSDKSTRILQLLMSMYEEKSKVKLPCNYNITLQLLLLCNLKPICSFVITKLGYSFMEK